MICGYYYFCGDHKCSLSGKYGTTISDSQYANYCKYNGYNCNILNSNRYRTNSNTNNPNNKTGGSGCFITTILCNILSKNDNDELLNNFRWFRDNVLQKDEIGKYDDILCNYDTIGQIISDCIVNDKDRYVMAFGLYKNSLLPINKLILQGQYDKACESYYVMTLALINYYGKKKVYNSLADSNFGYKDNEFDRKLAGHGKKKVLVNNSKENFYYK